MATPAESIFAIDITADTKFIEEIQRRVTVSGRLPFTIPPDHIPTIISDAAKVFYKKHYAAAETNRYIIKYSDLINRNVPYIKLPSYVIAVTDIQASNSLSALSVYSRRPNLMLMNSSRYIDFLNGTMSPSSYDSSLSGMSIDSAVYSLDSMDGIISLYSASLVDSFSYKGIQFDYNDNTNKLQILGDLNSDAIIEVREGIALRHLYSDELFIKYVTGKCLSELTTILSAFGFSMPGNIEINYSNMEAKGEKLIEQVEEAFEDEQPGDLFVMV